MFLQKGTKIVFIEGQGRELEGLKNSIEKGKIQWEIDYFTSASKAFESLDSKSPFLVVADLDKVDLNQLEICEKIFQIKIRNTNPVYLIVLSQVENVQTLELVLEKGADDYCLKNISFVEMVARIKVGLREIHLKNEILKLNRKLLWESKRDAVTRLLNRPFGGEILKRELEKVERGIQDLSLLLVEINEFKELLVEYGNSFGEHVLSESAQILQGSIRKYDSLIQWSQSQFLLVLPNTSLESAMNLGQRVLHSIHNHDFSMNPEKPKCLSGSIGVAIRPKESVGSLGSFIEIAEESLLLAKKNGSNSVKSLHQVSE